MDKRGNYSPTIITHPLSRRFGSRGMRFQSFFNHRQGDRPLLELLQIRDPVQSVLDEAALLPIPQNALDLREP